MTHHIHLLKIRMRTLSIVTLAMLALETTACAKDYADADMQPLAATASDLARAVMYYGRKNPDTAPGLDDVSLVQKATSYDPQLLSPYDGFVVRGTLKGVILVCTKDRARGLFEDAACSDVIDKPLWHMPDAPCDFTVDLRLACPSQ